MKCSESPCSLGIISWAQQWMDGIPEFVRIKLKNKNTSTESIIWHSLILQSSRRVILYPSGFMCVAINSWQYFWPWAPTYLLLVFSQRVGAVSDHLDEQVTIYGLICECPPRLGVVRTIRAHSRHYRLSFGASTCCWLSPFWICYHRFPYDFYLFLLYILC